MQSLPNRPLHTLPRLFIANEIAAGSAITLDKAASHYLTHVLRHKDGEKVRIFNGKQGEWLATLTQSTKASVVLVPESEIRKQNQSIGPILCCAPIKKAHFDTMVEKATELGVSHIQPILTERTQVREVNVERLADLAREAAEQSERLDIPTIAPALPLIKFWAAMPAITRVICAEWGNAEPLHTTFAKLSNTPPAIFTGPEGGFTENEMNVFRNSSGDVHFVRLGPRILRADTAAIAALACWQSQCGDWRL